MNTFTHRPEIHLALDKGILEAPAGALLDGNTFHLFFQYRATPENPSRWGHCFSEELPFDWLECDDVLAPVGGELNLRAGSVAALNSGINLYFTTVTSVNTAVSLARYESTDHICEVSDEEGVIDKHVRRHGKVINDDGDFRRLRSPCVVPDWADIERTANHEGWLMLALSGTSEAPVPVILSSPDGESWRLIGALEFAGDTGFPASDIPSGTSLPPVVSPRIIRLCDEVDGEIYDILLVTVEHAGYEQSGYLVGRLDGTTFEVVSPFQRLDYGHDFSRPRSTNLTPGTVVSHGRYDEALLFGLFNGTGRGDNPAKHPSWEAEGWANALSLPRHVTLQGGKLYQTPPRGLPDAISHSSRARSWTGLMEVPSGSSISVDLLDGNGRKAATITHSGEELILDRSPSSACNNFYGDSQPATCALDEGDSDSLTIIVDGSTVEVFADGGLVAMSSRVYFDNGCSGFDISTSGSAEILREWERAGS